MRRLTMTMHRDKIPTHTGMVEYADVVELSVEREYADVVELVDSLDLGSNARACRFESCHPHQAKERGISLSLLLHVRAGLEPIKMQQSGGLLRATA